MIPFRITVLHDPSPLSLNARLHWAERKRLNDIAKRRAYAAWLMAGRPTADQPVVVRITVRRGRTLDQDNALAGLKPVIDALFKAAITPDDSPHWVTLWPPQQETGKRWKGKEEVEFTIAPRE